MIINLPFLYSKPLDQHVLRVTKLPKFFGNIRIEMYFCNPK